MKEIEGKVSKQTLYGSYIENSRDEHINDTEPNSQISGQILYESYIENSRDDNINDSRDDSLNDSRTIETEEEKSEDNISISEYLNRKRSLALPNNSSEYKLPRSSQRCRSDSVSDIVSDNLFTLTQDNWISRYDILE